MWNINIKPSQEIKYKNKKDICIELENNGSIQLCL